MNKIIESLRDETESVIAQASDHRDDLQAEWDERSERWQEGDKGVEAQDFIDALGEIIDNLEAASDQLGNLA